MGTSIYVTNIMKINLFSSTADDTSTSLHRADENVDFDGNYRYRWRNADKITSFFFIQVGVLIIIN
jgi:hypothetical protein